MKNLIKNNKRAIFGGFIASIFMGIAVFIIGSISPYEGKMLLASSLDGINMLCNTVALASATILALLLTLLGISTGTDLKLKKEYYAQILSIAQFDTIVFIGSLILFQLFNIPITRSDAVPVEWFENIYWITIIVSSILSGMMITVILMLYTTLSSIIKIVGIGDDHHLIEPPVEEEKKISN